MVNPKPQRRTKEEREREFIEFIEQTLGFYLIPWQRRVILEARRNSLNGDPIDFGIINQARRKP